MGPDPYVLGTADIAAIVVVLLISASIGVFFRFSGGRQRTTKEFLMASRSMSPFPVVFSLIVTFVSAVMMLGIPADVFKFGLYRMLAYMCSTISNVISAYIFLPVYFQMGDSVSVYEYLERRFGKFTRKLGSVLFIVHSLFFMSVVLYAPALALHTVCNIDIKLSIISIGGVCTIYCCMGGMKAVLWTDVFQAIVMYISVFAIFIKGILLAETSIPEAFRMIHDGHSTHDFLSFDPRVRYTLWNCVMYGFLYGMYNYGCNQAQIQRMLSVKSLKLSQRAVVVSVPLAIIFIAMNFSLGIILYANYHGKNLIPREICKPDEMVPYFITKSFTDYPGLAGLCIAGIFSGSLSTISSSVNSLAAVTMEDFVRPFFTIRRKLTDSTAAILVKVFACAYGLAAILCAFAVQETDIVNAYTTLYGVTAGPILGLFTLGMMTVTANEKGALIGLVSGIFTTFALGIFSLVKKAENSLSKKSCEELRAALLHSSLNSTTTFHTASSDFTASSANANIFTDVYTTTEDDFTSTTNLFTTTDFLSTSAVNSTTDSTHAPSGPPEGEVLLSIMWPFIIGFAITTIIGYIASLLKSLSKNKAKEKISDVDPALLSPLVKKWIFKSLPQNDQGCSQELVKLNGNLES